jgi:hypothetical protein
MRKVGIVTFQYNNYGTKLQNFAMVVALQKMGFESSSIYIKYRKDTYRAIARDFIKSPIQVALKKRFVFSRFSDKYLRRLGVLSRNLERIDSKFNFFIAGSDQIWNPAHLSTRLKDEKLLFLKFANKNKRIAYAPSFGVDKIDGGSIEFYRSNLDGFSVLSVRESAGQDIILCAIGKSVPVVPDPTFLLSSSSWQSIAKPYDKKYAKRRYIAVYFLSRQNKLINKQIDEYAHVNNCSIIHITGEKHVNKNGIIPGPDEFVSLIANAQAIFTDSFHGAVFSIIMGIPFVVYKRTDTRQHSRIDNLLNIFDFQPAYYDGNRSLDEMISALDYSHVDSILAQMKKTGIDYLNSALRKVRS